MTDKIDVTQADRQLLHEIALNLKNNGGRLEREELAARHRIAAENTTLEQAAKVVWQWSNDAILIKAIRNLKGTDHDRPPTTQR